MRLTRKNPYVVKGVELKLLIDEVEPLNKTVAMVIEDEYSTREYRMRYETWVQFTLTAVQLIEDSKKFG
jgi:hypothetical protein